MIDLVNGHEPFFYIKFIILYYIYIIFILNDPKIVSPRLGIEPGPST
jgi:hypothetical protein